MRRRNLVRAGVGCAACGVVDVVQGREEAGGGAAAFDGVGGGVEDFFERVVGVGAEAICDQVGVEGEPRLDGGVGELFDGFEDVAGEVLGECVGALVKSEEAGEDVAEVGWECGEGRG